MNDTLDKRTLETTQNTINLLNTLNQLDMQTLGIKDRDTSSYCLGRLLESITM